jgi:cardiolipin synthase
MLVAKQVADLITICRAMLCVAILWFGFSLGAQALPLVVWMLIMAWTSDSLDGPIARRSRLYYNTWIGDHDLFIDVLVALVIWTYLMLSGFVSFWIAGGYILVWAVVFWLLSIPRSLGMLCQAPVYAWFIWIAIRYAPGAGMWLIIWILIAIIVTWPTFPKQIVPGFLAGMRNMGIYHSNSNN